MREFRQAGQEPLADCVEEDERPGSGVEDGLYEKEEVTAE